MHPARIYRKDRIMHYPTYSKQLGYKVRETRTITCSCGWVSPEDFDVRNKPLFAQHKRDAKAAA